MERKIEFPFISIVIPNFNGGEYLEVCLNSVLKSDYKNFEVILIDDKSHDSSVEIIKRFQRKDKRIILLRNERNIGAAASRNKGLAIAKGQVIVFLDNDTEVEKDWLGNLIRPLQKKGVGASQALLLDFERRDLIQMAGGLLMPQTGWLIPFYQWQKYSEIKNRLKEKSIVAISAALAVKKKVIDKIGVFDEKEAIYTEDLDFCWRIWLAGYKIVLAPGSRVFHWTKSVEERSGMKASYQQIYFYLAKNSFRSILKNYELFNAAKYFLMSLLINLGRGVAVLFTKKSLSALSALLAAITWNIENLSDTLTNRNKIQNTRMYSDFFVIRHAMTKASFLSIYKNYFAKNV